MKRWMVALFAALLLLAALPGAAWAVHEPEADAESRRIEVRHREDEGAHTKRIHHHMAMMKWLRAYPEEHQRWLTIMQERHLIQAELLGKQKKIAELTAAAEDRKDTQTLDAAQKVRDELMNQHAKAIGEKRKQMKDQCKALAEQQDKLKDEQIREAVGKLLTSAEEINALLKAKSQAMDEVIRALQQE